jgi:arginase
MADRRILSPRFIGRMVEAPMRLSVPGDKVITAAPGPGDETESVAPVHRALADAVSESLAAGERPVAILGDCCQVIGVMAGLARSDLHPHLVWIDSHGDFNTWETTPSGFLGGMPLAMLTGRGDQRMMEAVGLTPMADDRVVLGDARDLDPGERELVQDSGVRHAETMAELLDALPEGPIYLHFDTDIIDASEAPAFLYAVKGGPTADEMREAIAAIEATGRVIAFSATAAWDASKDQDRATEAAVRRAISPLLPS